MAVAATTPPTETERPAKPASLWLSSLKASLFVLGGIAVIFHGVPFLWDKGISSWLSSALGSTMNSAGIVVAQIAAAALLIILGKSISGPSPMKGLRGGIFLMISSFVAFAFIYQAIVKNIGGDRITFGVVLALLFNGLLLTLLVQMYRTGRFSRWAVGLENGGWFTFAPYKRTQGLRVRRLTIVGIHLLLDAGIYTLLHNNWLPRNSILKDGSSDHAGDWMMNLPGIGQITLLPDLAFTVPLILIGAVLWFAYRVVNFPPFADFLIATEAEMNKVSWTPRAQLFKDTIVVLVTMVLITLFLFIVDVAWNLILSRSFIGILPPSQEISKDKQQEVRGVDW